MKSLVFALIAFGTLALFNPDQADFSSFIAERAQTIASDNAREASGGLLSAGSSVVGSLTQALASNLFERKSYVVFSTYEQAFDGGQEGWKFLGMGGQFFELNRPDTLGG